MMKWLAVSLLFIAVGVSSAWADDRFAFVQPIPVETVAPEFRGAVTAEPVVNLRPVRINLILTVFNARDFDESLEASLAAQGLLATDPASVAYRLRPEVISVEPSGLTTKTAEMRVIYRLERIADGEVVAEREVVSRFSARVSGATVAAGVVARTFGGPGAFTGLSPGVIETAPTVQSGQDPVRVSEVWEASGPGPFDGAERQGFAYENALALNLRGAITGLFTRPASTPEVADAVGVQEPTPAEALDQVHSEPAPVSEPAPAPAP